MKVRRVVAGRDNEGKSVFVSCDAAPWTHDYVHIPGMSTTQLWSTPASPSLQAPARDPTLELRSVLPPPGGTRFVLLSVPPDSVMQSPQFNGVAAGEELLSVVPDLAERFEPDSPGMHTTDTVDCGVILEGEIWLELDGGREEKLQKHDVVVLDGVRHAWRNKTESSVLMAFVLVGARRG